MPVWKSRRRRGSPIRPSVPSFFLSFDSSFSAIDRHIGSRYYNIHIYTCMKIRLIRASPRNRSTGKTRSLRLSIAYSFSLLLVARTTSTLDLYTPLEVKNFSVQDAWPLFSVLPASPPSSNCTVENYKYSCRHEVEWYLRTSDLVVDVDASACSDNLTNITFPLILSIIFEKLFGNFGDARDSLEYFGMNL